MPSFEENVQQLIKLSAEIQKPRLGAEKIKTLSRQAFAIQDEIMAQLQEKEDQETDIVLIQNIFKTRELVWDIMKKIEMAELAVLEKKDKHD